MRKLFFPFLLFIGTTVFGQTNAQSTPPSFDGDFTEWFKSHVTFPSEGLQDGVTGKVEVLFTVNPDGRIFECKATGMPGYFREAALKGMEKLNIQPATLDGNPTPCKMKLLMDFSLLKDSASLAGLTVVETYSDPEFIRGMDSLMSYDTWLDQELRIPESLKNISFSESVRLTFVVDEQGKITTPRVTCSHADVARELERLLTECPAWEVPAMVNGKPRSVTVSEHLFCEIIRGSKSQRPFLIKNWMPTFQGGDLKAFQQWIMPGLRYPPVCAEMNISGTVVISFIIEKDGTTSSFAAQSSPAQ